MIDDEPVKKAKKTSPTQRTLTKLRTDGALMSGVVEKWNPFGGARKPDGTAVGNRVDLFGFIDVVAVTPTQVGILGIQACAASGITTRIKKVLDDPVLCRRARGFVSRGNRLLFWGWKQNKKTKRWSVDSRDFADLYAAKIRAENGLPEALFETLAEPHPINAIGDNENDDKPF